MLPQYYSAHQPCSCSKKENVAPTPTTQTTNAKGIKALMRTGGEVTYYSSALGCLWPAGNCTDLPPVIITSPWQFYKDALTIAETNGSGAVGALFNSADFAVICVNLDIASETDLKSGNYFIHLASEDATKATYIAGTTNPVTDQNMSFAFEFNK